MKNFTFLITFILLLLTTPSFATGFSFPKMENTNIMMEWHAGKKPAGFDIMWTVEVPGEKPSSFEMQTWYHAKQVMNFNIRIDSDSNQLTFLFLDRSNNHPNPAKTLSFQVDLPGNPAFLSVTDGDKDAATTMFPNFGFTPLGAIYLFESNPTNDFFLAGKTTATLNGKVDFTTSTVVTPEPGTAVLMFVGLVGLYFGGEKKNGNHSRSV